MRRSIVTVVVGIAAVLVGACSSADDSSPTTPSASGTGPSVKGSLECPDPIDGALPTWASDGFSPRDVAVSHLVGVRGAIVAVPFGWPLRVEQPAGHDNKILWIAKAGDGPLRIVATEESTQATVTVDLPQGPNPSIVDMPSAGCWKFNLTWGDQDDEILIRYYP